MGGARGQLDVCVGAADKSVGIYPFFRLAAMSAAHLSAQATCVSSTSSSIIDYFLVSSSICSASESCKTDASHHGRPHRPVQLRFREDAVHLQQLVYRTPEGIKVDLPFGPRPKAPDWSVASLLAEQAADAAAGGRGRFPPQSAGVPGEPGVPGRSAEDFTERRVLGVVVSVLISHLGTSSGGRGGYRQTHLQATKGPADSSGALAG